MSKEAPERAMVDYHQRHRMLSWAVTDRFAYHAQCQAILFVVGSNREDFWCHVAGCDVQD